jgi:hypothetical protein
MRLMLKGKLDWLIDLVYWQWRKMSLLSAIVFSWLYDKFNGSEDLIMTVNELYEARFKTAFERHGADEVAVKQLALQMIVVTGISANKALDVILGLIVSGTCQCNCARSDE